MNVNHEDFVAIYDNVFSPIFCDKIIDHYEWCSKNNRTWDREESSLYKKDNSTCLNPINTNEIEYCSNNLSGLIGEFNSYFWDICYKDYTDRYDTLNTYDNHTIYSYKVQKTIPGGGYHIWHCEDGSKHFSKRIGTYILYLNDVESGGETEFLYCGRRIEAKKGRLVIFPANYPWTHRGNPPLSGEKYIMTGWTEFS
jgi:hypothetical protein